MEFGILGPLQVLRDGEPLVLGGPRQRAVLARLLLEPGRVVPAGVLIEDVWSGDPPMTASKTLQKYVSQLRRTLGAGVVRTSGGGYAVDVDSGSIDAARFEQLLGDGKHEDALALWRGEALADLPDTFFALTERSRLQELRLVAVERRLGYALASGRHDDVVPRLMELAERYPLRERLCGLLMTALYRSGRQVEALQALRRHRRHLAEDVGLDPADELVALEQAILRHDPSLSPPGPMGGTPARTAGNLRLPASSFVGRDAERRRIADALHHNRVITLVGPGGVGKTRLATEVAAEVAGRYGGGVWLVDLSVLADPTLIDHHVVGTLGIAEQGGQDDESTVIAALEHRDPLLLVLDSCEHLVDRAAALVDRIVRTCPNVHVLATSRRPLGVDGELVLPTAPLPDRDACRLFSDRARLAGASRDDAVAAEVAGICRSLDGLPLALELAAARMKALS
ncbi:MAG: BTAD domain-containing putative transcriptional regulator, partial [Actinomycetes bacterium]